LLRSNSLPALIVSAWAEPKASTCTLWSITRSHLTSGLMSAGSPPSFFMASRIAARSTTQGTPVKSCSTTRPGMKGISSFTGLLAFHPASPDTSSAVTTNPSRCRSMLSSSTLIEYGRRSMFPTFFRLDRS
jgi:hypothetical protein